MGVINCQIHGSQSFYEVCEHIWDSLENEIIPVMKELPALLTKLCDECYNDKNVKELSTVTFDDVLKMPEDEQAKIEQIINLKYDNTKRRIKCIECLNSLLIKDARKNGKELPFKPYEKTLMHCDNKTIEELREILISNYDFQNFKNPYLKTQKAFHIKSGGISYPFSIKFYYVTQEEDQIKLIELIDNFFEIIDQKQRHIMFYESENWIIKETDNHVSEYRGEEKILKEIIVN